MFRLGKRRPKIGDMGQIRTKETIEIDQKAERSIDSIMAEKEGTENLPKAERNQDNGTQPSWGTIKSGVTSRIPKTGMCRIIGKQRRRRQK